MDGKPDYGLTAGGYLLLRRCQRTGRKSKYDAIAVVAAAAAVGKPEYGAIADGTAADGTAATTDGKPEYGAAADGTAATTDGKPEYGAAAAGTDQPQTENLSTAQPQTELPHTEAAKASSQRRLSKLVTAAACQLPADLVYCKQKKARRQARK